MIACVDKAGHVQQFDAVEYSEGLNDGLIHYQVHAVPAPSSGEFFSLTLTPIGDDVFRVTAISANHPAYRGMGIPEALFELVVAEKGVTIVSSPGKAGPGVWREPPATKMWDRMRAKERATYNPATDVYTFVP